MSTPITASTQKAYSEGRAAAYLEAADMLQNARPMDDEKVGQIIEWLRQTAEFWQIP